MIKSYLYLNSILYIVFGVWCAVDPLWTSAAVGFALPGAQGFAEYVAVYGGMEFGIGIFFLITALKAPLTQAGVLFGACFYSGIFVFRSFALMQVGLDIGAGLNFYISEGLLTAWSLYILFQQSRRTTESA